MKKILKMGLITAAAVCAGAATASAEIVCNDNGDCWHTRTHVVYPEGVRVRVHPDDWRWRDTHHYRWREHEGSGYWRGGVWVDIK